MASQVESIKWVPGTDFLVDGFKFKNPRCAHYFLTHFHSDHTIGLSKGFSGGLIYCSPVTARLLIHDMGLRAQFVRPLEVGLPAVVCGVRVTPLDANHCPGAVMFLFELPLAPPPAAGPGKVEADPWAHHLGGAVAAAGLGPEVQPGAGGRRSGSGAAPAPAAAGCTGGGSCGAEGCAGGAVGAAAGAGAQRAWGEAAGGGGGDGCGCGVQLRRHAAVLEGEEGGGRREAAEEDGGPLGPLGRPVRMEGGEGAAELCCTHAVKEEGRGERDVEGTLAWGQEGGPCTAARWRGPAADGCEEAEVAEEAEEAEAEPEPEEEEEEEVMVISDGEGPEASRGGGGAHDEAGAAQGPGAGCRSGGGAGDVGGGARAAETHNVLHTGDCRWQRWMRHQPGLRGVRVDTVFLDTTYAAPKHTMPPQHEAIDMMAQAMREARAEEPATLFVVAMYHIGKERALFGAAQQLGAKVWCSAAKRAVLQLLDLPPQQMGLLVDDPRGADVHVAGWGLRPEELQAYLDQFEGCWKRVVGVRATGWTLRQKGGVSVRREGDVAILGVPYSEHSSWSDLCDAVSQLRPRRLIPTVNAGTPEQRRALVDRFAALMDLSRDRSRLDVYLSRGGSTPRVGRAPEGPAASAARRAVDLGAVDLAEQQRILADLQQRAQQRAQQQEQQQQQQQPGGQRKRKRQGPAAGATPGPRQRGARARGSAGPGPSPGPAVPPVAVKREQPAWGQSPLAAHAPPRQGGAACPAAGTCLLVDLTTDTDDAGEGGGEGAPVEAEEEGAAPRPGRAGSAAGRPARQQQGGLERAPAVCLRGADPPGASAGLGAEATAESGGPEAAGGGAAAAGGPPLRVGGAHQQPRVQPCLAAAPLLPLQGAQQAAPKAGDRWQASIRSFFAPVGRALGL